MKSYKITYTERGVLKTLIKHGVNQGKVEQDFIWFSEGNSIELVSCERSEYIIQKIAVNIPYSVELYIKIEFTAKGAEIIEAFSNGQSWLEYIYTNGYQNEVLRHHKIESKLLEIQDEFLLNSVIKQRPIIQIKNQAAA